jgi:hypothetical protein
MLLYYTRSFSIYSGSLFRKAGLFTSQWLAQNSAQVAQFICNIQDSGE